MNWKQVKSIKIKEGDVKSLSINSQVVWSKGEVPPEPPVVVLPYSENFDKIEPNTIPKGWDFITNDKSRGGIYVDKDEYNSYSKPNCIKTDPSATQDCYAILPDFGVDIKKLTLSFWNKVEGESSYLMEVGYMDGGIAAENYVKIVDVARGEFRKYEQKSFKFKDLTIPGSGKGRLAIRYKSHGHTGWYTWLDNVEVDKVRARPNAFRFYNPGDQPVTIYNRYNSRGPYIEFNYDLSTDGVDWHKGGRDTSLPNPNQYNLYTGISIPPKGTLYIKGVNETLANDNGSLRYFMDDGPLECHGSIMDLVDGGTGTLVCSKPWMFFGLFSGEGLWGKPKTNIQLLTLPELPATTLSDYCYASLFNMAKGFNSLPDLPTTTLTPYCYDYIGANNPELNHVKIYATTWTPQRNWLSNVAPTGTIEIPADLVTWDGTGTQPEGSIPLNSPNGVPTGWTVKRFVPIPAQEPVTDKSFRFENKSNEPRTVSYDGKPGDANYENTKFIISKDGENWEWWNKVDGEFGNKPFETKTINAGEKLYIRGVGNKSLGTPPADSVKNGFNIPNQLEVHGDIHDLATGGVNGFSKLFYYCHITTVPEGINYNWSAQEGEFFAMLSSTDITKVSDNNSITIGSVDAKYSLWSLFQDCKQLTDISVKVDALCGDNTIGYMFHGCSNAHMNVRISYYTWNQNCANDWLYGTAGGNIYTGLTIDEYGGWDRIPNNWTFNGKPKPKTFNVPYSMNFDSITDENGQEVFPDVDLVYGNKNNLSNPSVMVWPDSWDVIGNGTSTSEGVVYVDRPSSTPWPLSNNCLYSVGAPNKTIYVVLPKFNLTVNLLKLKYWLRCEQVGSSFDVTVGHMTNINNPDTFVENTNYDNTTSEGEGMWHEINWSGYSVGEADRIAFRFSNAGANNFYTWLDNITVTQV